jgi:cytochrome c-type biogenesis protein CcmH
MNRNSLRVLSAVLPALAVLLLVPANGFAELTQSEVTESLYCAACLGEMDLATCNDSTAIQMRSVVDQMIGQGKNKQEILDYFVAQYGDNILTALPKKGFNLIAYTGPFISLLVGILVAVLIIRRWGAAGRRASTGDGTTGQSTRLDEKTRLQIEKELSALDEEN